MLAECARMLWRRRLWVAIVALLAVAAGVGAYVAITPGQESKAQVLFLGSIKQPGVTGATNPYLNFGGSLAITASAVQQGVTSDQTAQKLYEAGNQATYKVEPNLAENAGPVLLVTVDDPSPAMVERTLKAVVTVIADQLKALQVDQNVPADLFITAQTLTTSPHPVAVHKAQTQKAVIAFLAVLIVLIASILLFERRRIARVGAQSDALQVDQPVTEGDHPSEELDTSDGASEPVTPLVPSGPELAPEDTEPEPVSEPAVASKRAPKPTPARTPKPTDKLSDKPAARPAVSSARRARFRGQAWAAQTAPPERDRDGAARRTPRPSTTNPTTDSTRP